MQENSIDIIDDFTAASVINDICKLDCIYSVLSSVNSEEITVSIEELNQEIINKTDCTGLTPSEFNSLMVSLANNGAAIEVDTEDGGYHKYEFRISVSTGLDVLEQQIIVVSGINELQPLDNDGTDIRLVATLPDSLKKQVPDSIGSLSVSLRNMLINASNSVRIANPYFDTEQRIINDIAALPQRGVDTRILTREIDPNTEGKNQFDVAKKLAEIIGKTHSRKIQLRDFYNTSYTGKQTGATHAKIVCIDEQTCYIGSANMTELSMHSNFEFGVVIEGNLSNDVARVFDSVFEEADEVIL